MESQEINNIDQSGLESLFESYLKELTNYCSVERYEFVIPSSHFRLDDLFNKVKSEIEHTITHASKAGLYLPLKNFNDKVYQRLRSTDDSRAKYARKSHDQYKKIYDVTSFGLNEINAKTLSQDVPKPVSNFKKPILSDFNKPVINKKQVLALMKVFKEFKVTNKDLTDRALAESFATLTGYTGDQLRKDFSDMNKGEILFKQDEIDSLKYILINMSKAIETLPLK